jgi:hypothetical protein
MVSPCSARTGAVALITAFWASVSGTMSLGPVDPLTHLTQSPSQPYHDIDVGPSRARRSATGQGPPMWSGHAHGGRCSQRHCPAHGRPEVGQWVNRSVSFTPRPPAKALLYSFSLTPNKKPISCEVYRTCDEAFSPDDMYTSQDMGFLLGVREKLYNRAFAGGRGVNAQQKTHILRSVHVVG